jgi:hypothetical protein
MKRLIILILWLLTPWSLSAAGDVPDGGKLQQLCNQDRFAKPCLAGLLSFRCGQYHQDLRGLGRCLDTSIDTASLIDLKPTTKDSSVLAVAYAEELVALMKSPFTAQYLAATRNAVDEAIQHHAPFSLWDHTLRFMNGDRSQTLRYLGVLFQDTSSAEEHVEYLKALRPSGVDNGSVELLSELMDLLQPEQLQKENFRDWLRLYPFLLPPGSENVFNPNLYHFYTLGYLSLRLKWRTANKKLAAFQPFWIEVAYKFRGISPERWPLDPKPFSQTKFESALRDIYAAYLATQWAAGLPAPKIAFPAFAERMAKNPSGFLRELYSTFR